MKKKVVKALLATMALFGAVMVGCGTSDTAADSFVGTDTGFLKNDAKNMWGRIDLLGIAGYFDSLSRDQGAPVIGGSALVNSRCAAPALSMDENTRYLDELESLFDEGEQVEGVCGLGLKLQDGQVAPLGVNLIDSMKVGTVEFWFRPNEDFYEKGARTLLGNDGARIHFFYKNGELYFQKNHHNLHYYVNGKAELKKDWNLIAGQWGDGYMSVWLNGEMVARWEHAEGYAPAQRGIPFENLVVIGYKSKCCMEGPGQFEAMTTSGSFDQFRISNIPRYKMPADSGLPETVRTDSVAVDTAKVDSAKTAVDEIDSVNTDVVKKDSTKTDSTLASDKLSSSSVASSASKNDSESLWLSLNQGISSYFALPENVPQASAVPGECPMNSLVKDKYTLFMDELETIYKEGRLVDGVCGRALALDDGEVAPLGINLDSTIDSGTVEFWFRPDSAFYTSNTRTLLGNDGARIHFLYKNGELVFQKNQSNKHIFVKGKAEFKSGWNLIAGQWDGHTLSLWLNGEEVAQTESASVYEPSNRNGAYGNILLIGFKSSCCMEAIDVGAGLTTSGAYDQVRVSSVPRYSAQK